MTLTLTLREQPDVPLEVVFVEELDHPRMKGLGIEPRFLECGEDPLALRGELFLRRCQGAELVLCTG